MFCILSCSVRMYSHTIVYFYIRTSENLVNVGSSRHKLPRHLQFCVGDMDPSGQNWSDTACRRRHVATCRQHFQLSSPSVRAWTVREPLVPLDGRPTIVGNDAPSRSSSSLALHTSSPCEQRIGPHPPVNIFEERCHRRSGESSAEGGARFFSPTNAHPLLDSDASQCAEQRRCPHCLRRH